MASIFGDVQYSQNGTGKPTPDKFGQQAMGTNFDHRTNFENQKIPADPSTSGWKMGGII